MAASSDGRIPTISCDCVCGVRVWIVCVSCARVRIVCVVCG